MTELNRTFPPGCEHIRDRTGGDGVVRRQIRALPDRRVPRRLP